MDKDKENHNNPEKAVQQMKLLLMIVLVIALAVPFLATNMAVRSIDQKLAKLKLGDQEVHADKEKKDFPMAFYKPMDFLVNLGDTDIHHYLRATVSLGFYLTEEDMHSGNSAAKGGGHGAPPKEEVSADPVFFKFIQNQEPIVRDTVISVISSYKMNQLVMPSGKQELKETLQNRLRSQLKNESLEIYFTAFTLQ